MSSSFKQQMRESIFESLAETGLRYRGLYTDSEVTGVAVVVNIQFDQFGAASESEFITDQTIVTVEFLLSQVSPKKGGSLVTVEEDELATVYSFTLDKFVSRTDTSEIWAVINA